MADGANRSVSGSDDQASNSRVHDQAHLKRNLGETTQAPKRKGEQGRF